MINSADIRRGRSTAPCGRGLSGVLRVDPVHRASAGAGMAVQPGHLGQAAGAVQPQSAAASPAAPGSARHLSPLHHRGQPGRGGRQQPSAQTACSPAWARITTTWASSSGPLYFKENQMRRQPARPHRPAASPPPYSPPTRATAWQLAQKERLPAGHTRHHRAASRRFAGRLLLRPARVKLYGDESADIADFRYDGPTPADRARPPSSCWPTPSRPPPAPCPSPRPRKDRTR